MRYATGRKYTISKTDYVKGIKRSRPHKMKAGSSRGFKRIQNNKYHRGPGGYTIQSSGLKKWPKRMRPKTNPGSRF